MTRPQKFYQGADYILECEVSDASASTEVELIIDTNPIISKTLSAGEIALTSIGFDVTILAADTATKPAGLFRYQARVTIGGKLSNVDFTPDQVRIKESNFVTSQNVRDYSS